MPEITAERLRQLEDAELIAWGFQENLIHRHYEPNDTGFFRFYLWGTRPMMHISDTCLPCGQCIIILTPAARAIIRAAMEKAK